MLAAVGVKWVLVGHSERRQYFGETNETVLKRTQAALEVRTQTRSSALASASKSANPAAPTPYSRSSSKTESPRLPRSSLQRS